MRIILGIAAYYHDSSAALVRDGDIVAAVQEERFTRRKHDPGFPVQAIQFCLGAGNCQLKDLDAIIFYDKPLPKFERLLETYMGHAPRGIRSFLRSMPIWLKDKLYLKSLLRRELRDLGGLSRADPLPDLLFAEHHQSHAASAFYPSPFQSAAVLCLDGVGEWATTSTWQGDGDGLQPLQEIHFPHSLGLLYSAFTQYCGFRVNSGEYKLMGLAPYGNPRFTKAIYANLLQLRPDGSFALNLDYFDYPVGDQMVGDRFCSLFGESPLEPDSTPTQLHMDLAASVQQVTEDVVLRIARHLHATTGSSNLCMAGGVALNCVANGRLLREGPFEDIWIQPASGDAGGSIGAALLAWHQNRDNSQQSSSAFDRMRGSYLGPDYDDETVRQFLTREEIPFTDLPDSELYTRVAADLADGLIVGWFQGKAEFGPRALGNRSILGDPRDPGMQKKMNLKIKQRESFRPFAPAVTRERARDFFELDRESPYMLLVADVSESLRYPAPNDSLQGVDRLSHSYSELPAITHVDYSARVQTVATASNPRFHKLLEAFSDLTGYPVLINTSFNVRGEPPVCSPADALNCFLATDIDRLVIGNIIIDKREQDPEKIQSAGARQFAPD